jgi:hypothetical protein
MKHYPKLIVIAGIFGLAAHAAEPPADLIPPGSMPASSVGGTELPTILAAGKKIHAGATVPVVAALTAGVPLSTVAILANAPTAGIDPLREAPAAFADDSPDTAEESAWAQAQAHPLSVILPGGVGLALLLAAWLLKASWLRGSRRAAPR